MSNLSVTKKVTVRGWNPDRTEQFVGEASPARSPLGELNAAASLKDFPAGDFVQGCTHRFDPGPPGAPGGYVTIMRLARNAEKG